jgi:magnesium and cobalt exporter, CNNM family
VILQLLALGGLLLLANGLFVAAELGFVATRRTRLEGMARVGNRRAVVALSVMAALPTALAATQLGVTMASIGLGMTAEAALEDVVDPMVETLHWLPDPLLVLLTAIVSLGVVTFLHTLLGEMVPKNLAIADPERTALWLAIPVRLFATVTAPAVRVLAGAGELLLRAVGVEPRQEISGARTAEDIAAVLSTSRLAGEIEERDARLVAAAIRFATRTAESVMREPGGIQAVPEGVRTRAVEDLAAATGHLSLPVYRVSPDRVIGVVRVHDVLGLPPDRPLPEELVRPVLRVPRSLPLTELLSRMRATGVHVAVVTEEGPTAGLLTLQDLLTALAG